MKKKCFCPDHTLSISISIGFFACLDWSAPRFEVGYTFLAARCHWGRNSTLQRRHLYTFNACSIW